MIGAGGAGDTGGMMAPSVQVDRSAIADLCRRHGVTRLGVFGSALTDRFDPQRSDIDVVVDFLPDAERTFRALFTLRGDLEALFGRPVDVVEARLVRNPYINASLQSAEVLYVA